MMLLRNTPMTSPAVRTVFLLPAMSLLVLAVQPSVAADAPQTTTATRPAKPVTNHDVHRRLLDLHRQARVGAYQEMGKRNPKWDADAIEYLELIARQAAASDVPEFYRPV